MRGYGWDAAADSTQHIAHAALSGHKQAHTTARTDFSVRSSFGFAESLGSIKCRSPAAISFQWLVFCAIGNAGHALETMLSLPAPHAISLHMPLRTVAVGVIG